MPACTAAPISMVATAPDVDSARTFMALAAIAAASTRPWIARVLTRCALPVCNAIPIPGNLHKFGVIGENTVCAAL
ncbi:MAG: hypothetical protein U0Z70_09720 [Thermomicrobiales bacterium]